MSDTHDDKPNDALEIAEAHGAAKQAGWWDVVRSRSFPNQEVPAPTLCAFRDGYAAAKLKYRVASSAVVASAPVTQCLTAGGSNAVTEAERLVCAKCGCPAFQQMRYFPYDLHPHADYPHGHPERCTKMDAWAEGLERDGKQGWRCHKRLGHSAGNGGEHCSTHRDCGFVRDGQVCGMEPDHDGPHAGEGAPFIQSASGEFLTDVCEELFGSFARHAGGQLYLCALCDEAIPMKSWVHAPHAEHCIIPKVREYLAQHKPACVPVEERERD